MIRFNPGNLPQNKEGFSLWVHQHFQEISAAINNLAGGTREVRHEEPVKVAEGMVVCADGTDWNPGHGAGWYQYIGSLWVPIGSQVEAEHLVGDTGEPAFVNSWANYTTISNPARFYLSPRKRVWLSGYIDTGVTNTTAFTLPVGSRPPYQQSFIADATSSGGGHGGHAHLVIGTDGTVKPNFSGGGTATFFSLDGMSFRVA